MRKAIINYSNGENMSYRILGDDRDFCPLSEKDRNAGYARLFPYYDKVRKHNGSIYIDTPNLNKILEYCCYMHDYETIPKDLLPLKSAVHTFFTALYGKIEDSEFKKNLFAHFIVRECNKKELPISQQALKHLYYKIFQERMDTKTLTWVSNYCGLYYTKRTPYDYLVDKDQFDTIFSLEELEGAVVQDSPTPIVNFYNFLNPKGVESRRTPSEIEDTVLACAFHHFQRNPFTTDQLISKFCSDYGVEESVWGWNKKYNKAILRDKVNLAMHNLRKNKMVKKAPPKTNLVTTKGEKFYKKQFELCRKESEIEDFKYTVLTKDTLCFNSALIDDVMNMSFAMEDTYSTADNNVSDIVLQSHYEINHQVCVDHPVEVPFQKLIDHICDVYDTNVLCWGLYRNTNRPTLKKVASQYKSKLTNNGYLRKGSNGTGIITQKGIDLVESWLSETSTEEVVEQNNVIEISNFNSNLDCDGYEEETPVVQTVSVSDLIKENIFLQTNPTPIEEDFNSEVFSAEEGGVVEEIVTKSEEVETENTDYDEYLKKVLSENDFLTKKIVDMKSTVDKLISFIKEKELLSEYIISISKKDTQIPF